VISHLSPKFINNFYIGDSLTFACRFSSASSQHAITVGGTAEDEGIYFTSWRRSFGSNYGKCVTLYAPAQLVTTAAVQVILISMQGLMCAC